MVSSTQTLGVQLTWWLTVNLTPIVYVLGGSELPCVMRDNRVQSKSVISGATQRAAGTPFFLRALSVARARTLAQCGAGAVLCVVCYAHQAPRRGGREHARSVHTSTGNKSRAKKRLLTHSCVFRAFPAHLDCHRAGVSNKSAARRCLSIARLGCGNAQNL